MPDQEPPSQPASPKPPGTDKPPTLSTRQQGQIILGLLGVGLLALMLAAFSTVRAFRRVYISLTPTATQIDKHATLTPEEAARNRALAGVKHNDAWQPFTTIINGHEMALVPAGCFEMGGEDRNGDAEPVHRVCFEQPFWIDVYEYGSGVSEDNDSNFIETGAEYPRNNIDWFQAQRLCVLRGARLPSEAEWEYAARGPDGLTYPWGDAFERENVVYSGNHPRGGAAVLGSIADSASWVGAHDLSGNLWEWVHDWYAADYYESLADGVVNPGGPPEGTSRVMRGGSWYESNPLYLRSATRSSFAPGLGDVGLGFRCARSFTIQ